MASLPRLLVLTSTYPRWKDDPEPGFVHELSRRLSENYEVHVLCPHSRFTESRAMMDGVHVHRYRYAPGRLETLVHGGGILANLRAQPLKWLLVPLFLTLQTVATYRATRTLKPDAVHAHWIIPQGFIYALVSSLVRSSPPMLLTSHGADIFALQSRLLGILKRLTIRRSNKLTVVSRSMAKKAIELGTSSSRVSVVSMGVDFESSFRPGNRKERSRNELLFVGRLVEKKGLFDLLESLNDVLTELPDTILNIAGYGPLERDLKHLVAERGLSENVRFLGAKNHSELANLYRRAALFVSPFIRSADGDQDGLGLVVIEAIACECPVLVSDLPVIHDILDPKLDARFLVAAGSPGALSTRIVQLLKDRDAILDEARCLRARILDRFSWNTVAHRYQELLTEIMSSKPVDDHPES